MVTMYTADGDRVAVTQHCSANNKRHMRTVPICSSPSKLDFSFVSVTNLTIPNVGHMYHLTVSFQDNEHFTQGWTWKEKGKEGLETFHFACNK